ncbi:hypothetical protein LNAOJCKE_5674 [Methylorubrum aminovorans]|uniref:Uncharacterized protein n=1 Tax=Methylorubrum aminovorans TaxID=269069 RepID=A0ABQ4UM60_9HYPH|nr:MULTISPECIES: hypothetical protein [Methylobacteriaceae]GJE68431.1 hypothetical protein LNAOJCKE_5674 [Methylorubrum aminovorans]
MRLFSRDPSFENARVIVKLVGHLAELQYDRVVLRGQRFCQFAAKLSLLAEIVSCGMHAVKMTKFAQNASHNSVRTLRQAMRAHADGDRQFVAILSAVPEAGLEAVEAACMAALAARLFSAHAVLNLLARGRESVPPAPVPTPASLTLEVEAAADCARYDGLRALEAI